MNDGLSNTFSHKARSLDGNSGHLVLIWPFGSDIEDRSFFSLSALSSLISWLFVFVLLILSFLGV